MKRVHSSEFIGIVFVHTYKLVDLHTNCLKFLIDLFKLMIVFDYSFVNGGQVVLDLRDLCIDERLDRLLEISVLRDVSLRAQVNLGFNFIDLAGQAALDLVNLLLIQLSHLLDGAFPGLLAVLLVLIRRHDKEEAILICIFLGVNVECELAHDLNLGLDHVKFLVLDDVLKCIAHDRDQHVKHGNLRDESSQHEK